MNIDLCGGNKRGFTLVEVLLASGLVVVLIGWLIVLLIQFQRGFSKGEEAGVILSESEMFLASLRYDLINAVGPRDASQPDWDKYLTVTPEKISFQIFRDADGAVDPVEYVYEKSPEGGSIQRFQSSSRRRLIDHHIASLTWDVGTALVQSPGIASGFRQIWVSVRFSVGGKVKLSGKTREVLIETKIFPTRLNQQLNCRERASDALVDF